MKKVLIVCNREDHIARGYRDAFSRKGICTEMFDLGKENHWVDRYIFHTVNHWLHNFRILTKGHNLFELHPLSHKNFRSTRLLSACKRFGPDLVFHIRSWTILPDILEDIRRECHLVGWWIEGDHRLAEVMPSINLYDRFYFFSTSCVETAQAQGYNGIGFLPHAIDTEVFHPMTEVEEIYDWVFVGRWTQMRQAALEGIGSIADSFAIYGPGWQSNVNRSSNIYNGIKGKEIWGTDLLALYNSAKIVLNITQWVDNENVHRGMNARILEVLACGRCLLTDYTADSMQLFMPGVHFEVFKHQNEIPAKISRLLTDKKVRDILGRNGMELVSQVYSFDYRVEQIIREAKEIDISKRTFAKTVH